MELKRKRRLRFQFGVRTMLVIVALVGVSLAMIARPVYERKGMMRWIEENGGIVDRWHKPEPIELNSGSLTIVITSYQRVLGPEKEPEIPAWRERLGDVPVNIIMLPADSNNSDFERARSLFPEAEVDVFVAAPGSGGFF
jgi:hypothetical protein